MSLPRPGKDIFKPNSKISSGSSADPAILHKKTKLEESDEELLMVPDVESEKSRKINDDSSRKDHGNNGGGLEFQNQSEFSAKRRRGRNPVDKEHRRLKRLLRNRVSAQQARERKKVYVNELETRERELQESNAELEEKISILINENTMLRKVLMNTRPKADENVETNARSSG